jgi:hypothetical protein
VEAFAERLARLSELSPDELSALEQEIVAAFDDADTSGDVETMQSLADALDALREEQAKRGAPDEAESDAAAQAEPMPEPVAADGAPAEQPAAAAPAAETPPATTETETPAAVPAAEGAPEATMEGDTVGDVKVTAEDVPEGHQPQAVAASAPNYVIRAGGDIPGITGGSVLEDMDAVVDAMTRKVNTMRGVGGDGEYVVVASIRSEEEIPEERMLRRGDTDGNARKMRQLLEDPAQTTPEALIATGWCAPRAPIYDVPTIGTTSRPVRDAIPSMGMERGGVLWMQPPGLSGAFAALSRWSFDGENWVPYAGPTGTTAPVAGQGGVSDDYVTGTKPCFEITCGEEITADLEAIPMCLCFDNLTTRAFPEWIRANTDLTLVAQARFAEQYLLALMFSQAPIGSTPDIGEMDIPLGAVRDLLVTTRLVASQFRWRNRLDPNQPMQWLAPRWLQEAMVSDLQVQAVGDATLGTSYSEIDGYLTAANISPIWYIDDVPAMAAGDGGAQPQPAITAASNFDAFQGYAQTAEWLMYPTGAFVRGDGGSLDLGVVRTKDDVVRNKYCEFAETFETLAYMGPADSDGWAIRGSYPVLIAGLTAGTTETDDGVVAELVS